MNYSQTPEQPKKQPPWFYDPEHQDIAGETKKPNDDAVKNEKEKASKVKDRKAEAAEIDTAKKKKREAKEKSEHEQNLEKKQKRINLVERSVHYKKQYEKELISPQDPTTLTRLLVAEHIVALHERITHPASDEIDAEQLLNSLDYLGALSDKLEYPEEESTPEIDETCDVLLGLAQNVLDEQVHNVPTIIQANKEAAELLDGQASPDASQLSPAAFILIATLSRTKTSHKQHDLPVVDLPTQTTTGGGSMGTPLPDRPLNIPKRPAQSSPTSSPLSHEIHQTPRETSNVEYRGRPASRTPDRIAFVAIASAVQLARNNEALVQHEQQYQPASTPRYENPPVAATSPHEIAAPIASHIETAPQHPATIYSSYQSLDMSPVQRHDAVYRPVASMDVVSHVSRKLEHLPLQSLLAMAETVPIGYGKRLKSAYEKGLIDKEGLIKILKSRSKNNDFLREYKQQVVARRNRLQSSPEFLTAPSSSDTITALDGQSTNSTTLADIPAQATGSMPNESVANKVEAILASKAAPEDTSTGWRKVLIAAGALGVAVVILIFIFAQQS